MRITKAVLKVRRQQILGRLRALFATVFNGQALADNPALAEAFTNKFPHREPGMRPAFSAAAAHELAYEIVVEAIPTWWVE